MAFETSLVLCGHHLLAPKRSAVYAGHTLEYYAARHRSDTLISLPASLTSSNIYPENATANGHDFQMFSFEETTSCKACQMLLRCASGGQIRARV